MCLLHCWLQTFRMLPRHIPDVKKVRRETPSAVPSSDKQLLQQSGAFSRIKGLKSGFDSNSSSFHSEPTQCGRSE